MSAPLRCSDFSQHYSFCMWNTPGSDLAEYPQPFYNCLLVPKVITLFGHINGFMSFILNGK